MKKIIVSSIVIIAFVLYAVFYHNSASAVVPATRTSAQSSGRNSNTGIYKNGAYTGSAADAYYGTIQVKATIQNGKISDVQFLQYPHDQSESVEVNQQAMPLLKQEAIQSQKADVDIVSGATQTSQAFKQSLASALTQAK